MVLALDIAKKTGFAHAENGKIKHGTFKLHINKFEANEMLETIAKAPDFDDVDVIVYESQGGNLNAHNNGVLKGALFQRYYNPGIEYVGVHPKTWQKWVSRRLGYDRIPKEMTTKELSVTYANKLHKIELKATQHDEADAICILDWYNKVGKFRI
jgi:hypothetical protein